MNTNKTLLVIHSHSKVNDMVARHWPWYRLGGTDILGIGRVDTHCEWPADIEFTHNIGREGYCNDGDNLCRRLVDTFHYLVNTPKLLGYSDFCLIEADCILTRPLPEHTGGFVTTLAGGHSPGFKGNQFFHPPWWADRNTAALIAFHGMSMLDHKDTEKGFHDRFIGWLFQMVPLKWTRANSFTRNALDRPEHIGAAIRAILVDRAFCVHGVKTEDQLKQLLIGLPEIAQCPQCKRWVADNDGFGVLAHLEPAYKGGCGYCSHPNSLEGKCGLCGKETPCK